MNKLVLAAAIGVAAALFGPSEARAVDVGDYVKHDSFSDIKISPTGDYFAATVPLEDRTILVVIDRLSHEITGTFRLHRNTHVSDFRWVSDERLVMGLAEKFGSLEAPVPTGELFAMNADGRRAEMLVGFRVNDGGLGTLIKPKKDNDRIAAFLVDSLSEDERSALISVRPYLSADPYTSVERIDLFTGRRQRVASVPVRRASFHTDNKGVVRFAEGSDSDNVQELYYRSDNDADWELIHSDRDTGRFEYPIGFSADDSTAYLRVQQPTGPDAIVALDLTTRERTEVLRDDDADPANVGYDYSNSTNVIYRAGTRVPVGVFLMDGKPRTAFLDDAAPEARLYRSLEAAFAGSAVEITSQTKDGRLALVKVYSDRSPGDFYLFDTEKKKADFVLSRREWITPGEQAEMKPVRFQARDGISINGYLTMPRDSDGKDLPMVVMPHGGPFGIQDVWRFDDDVQLLAAAGYAVLQVNFRGSGGYGRAFREAGAREWGGKMQDDLSDATRWAVQQGVADPDRICMSGASYGAYAALMGAVREPELYKCAAGHVGVYDLPAMVAENRRAGTRWGNWSLDWVGEAASLGALSPNRMAERIKVPVFLSAGGEDPVAPIEHSKMMERALLKAGVPVETLYFDNEGHGFYVEAHQREYYTRLLAFLARHLGGEVAAVPAGGAADTGK